MFAEFFRELLAFAPRHKETKTDDLGRMKLLFWAAWEQTPRRQLSNPEPIHMELICISGF